MNADDDELPARIGQRLARVDRHECERVAEHRDRRWLARQIDRARGDRVGRVAYVHEADRFELTVRVHERTAVLRRRDNLGDGLIVAVFVVDVVGEGRDTLEALAAIVAVVIGSGRPRER